MAETPKTKADLIVPATDTFYRDHGKEYNVGWEKQERDKWDRNLDVFVAIYNNDFVEFKKLCKEPPDYLVKFYEELDAQGKLRNEGKLYYNNTEERETNSFIIGVLKNDIRYNKTIDKRKTMTNLGLLEKEIMGLYSMSEYDFNPNPRHYILIRLEKMFSTYKSTSTEEEKNNIKNNIKALWNMLTFSTNMFDKRYDSIIERDIFQNFLRSLEMDDQTKDDKVVPGYKKIVDEVIDKDGEKEGEEGKNAFIKRYIIYTMGEKAQRAKQELSDKLSSINPFNRNKTTATTEVAPPEKKSFLSGFLNKDAAPKIETPATTGTGTPGEAGKGAETKSRFSMPKLWSGGGRESRKQRKSKKQQKSRKQGKKSRSRK